MFYGILIRMYLGAKEHNLPHIHAFYQDVEAVFDIRAVALLDGQFPTKQRKLVEAWIEIHKVEFLANWALAQAGGQPFKIEPLR